MILMFLVATLITDWYSLPSQPNEQIKLAVFVLDKELRSDAIRVVVYVQSRQGNVWKDAGIDPQSLRHTIRGFDPHAGT